MNRRDFDGVLMGDSQGALWRIYEPAWWQVRRWWRWIRYRWFPVLAFEDGTATKKATLYLTVTMMGGRGNSLQLRALLADDVALVVPPADVVQRWQ